MNLKINGSNGFIKIEHIISAVYVEHSQDFKEVQISSNVGFSSLKVQSKQEAEDIIKEISNYKEPMSKDTYLDGFKDGLEYALKMAKESK